jgi:hypothetical protein
LIPFAGKYGRFSTGRIWVNFGGKNIFSKIWTVKLQAHQPNRYFLPVFA